MKQEAVIWCRDNNWYLQDYYPREEENESGGMFPRELEGLARAGTGSGVLDMKRTAKGKGKSGIGTSRALRALQDSRIRLYEEQVVLIPPVPKMRVGELSEPDQLGWRWFQCTSRLQVSFFVRSPKREANVWYRSSYRQMPVIDTLYSSSWRIWLLRLSVPMPIVGLPLPLPSPPQSLRRIPPSLIPSSVV
jgi:hypothetical protein